MSTRIECCSILAALKGACSVGKDNVKSRGIAGGSQWQRRRLCDDGVDVGVDKTVRRSSADSEKSVWTKNSKDFFARRAQDGSGFGWEVTCAWKHRYFVQLPFSRFFLHRVSLFFNFYGPGFRYAGHRLAHLAISAEGEQEMDEATVIAVAMAAVQK